MSDHIAFSEVRPGDVVLFEGEWRTGGGVVAIECVVERAASKFGLTALVLIDPVMETLFTHLRPSDHTILRITPPAKAAKGRG